MYSDEALVIRPIKEEDLYDIWELIFKEDSPEWKKWDAPYYPHSALTYEEFLRGSGPWVNKDDRWLVEVDEVVVGTVSYYWEDEASKWLEIGIVLYQPNNWSRGLGTRTLKMWTDHLFNTLPLVRVGLTTWSGNERMIRVAQKLGMQMEARIRKVRYYDGHYYDSIRMGILREEWTGETE